MKASKFSKITRILFLASIAVLLAFALIAAAFADSEVKTGEQSTVTFSFPNTFGVDGEITLSDPDFFTQLSISDASEGEVSGNVNSQTKKFYLWSTSETEIKLEITGTVNPAKATGDTCTITVQYSETINENGDNVTRQPVSQTLTVTAKGQAQQDPSETGNNNGQSTNKDPSGSSPTGTGQTSNPTGNGGNSTNPGGNSGGGNSSGAKDNSSLPNTKDSSGNTSGTESKTINKEELEKLIDEYSKLIAENYSTDSWNSLERELASAKAILESAKTQAEIDEAVKALKEARNKLEGLDYSVLDTAIENATKYTDAGLSQKYTTLVDKLAAANSAKKSRSQKEIDNAAQELNSAIGDIKNTVDGIADPKTVPGKTVEKEVEPKEPFCNKTIHSVFLIVMIISLILNAVLGTFLFLLIRKRKKAGASAAAPQAPVQAPDMNNNADAVPGEITDAVPDGVPDNSGLSPDFNDTIPLVDYDITDDDDLDLFGSEDILQTGRNDPDNKNDKNA